MFARGEGAMIRFDPEAFYDEDALRLLGLDGTVLAKARRRGELRCRQVGRIRLYKGEWLQQWLSAAEEGRKDRASWRDWKAGTTSNARAGRREVRVASGEGRRPCDPTRTSKRSRRRWRRRSTRRRCASGRRRSAATAPWPSPTWMSAPWRTAWIRCWG